EIVEAFAAACLLQPVDASETAVVGHDDGELCSEHHGGRDFGIEHQVAAVAHHDHDFAFGPRHLDADTPRDLVAHARVTVFDVISAGPRRTPELVQLAGERSRRAYDDVVFRRARMPLHRS